MKKLFLLLVIFGSLTVNNIQAQEFVTTTKTEGAFPVVGPEKRAMICVDTKDYFVVRKAARMLSKDIKRVTDNKADITHRLAAAGQVAIIIGSIDKSAMIQHLVEIGKISVDKLRGKWESFKLQVVDQPKEGIKKALVIVGSDARGTAYGVFTLSRKMGVSPWRWWADVPAKEKENVFVKEGTYFYGPPAVKYRGIFLNDGAPALSGWVHEKYGGFNHEFYVRVFKLLLRLRANYLWPAMWGHAFAADDLLNPMLADKYGIVMGTAHNEPMMRAQDEWAEYGSGPWNYRKNGETLRKYWREGIQRMNGYQSIVTIGMRGDGDKPMSDSTNIKLLESIIQDQREIIEEVTGEPASETPQVWTLYKEVLAYYDGGMRVPDDVTVMYPDDNWGNIRRLPDHGDSTRAGGYGLYYHFDYVGGPRSYKWINTNTIPKIWYNLNMAYQHHVRRIWVVNVGDLKPMEFPISFFMAYAWNPKKWPAERLPEYTQQWAKQQFGPKYAEEIATIMIRYSKYNARRKPILMSADTYSLMHYREAERVVDNYNELAEKAKQIYNVLPEDEKAAFYQLVLYPAAASANLTDMYVTTAQNRLYAKQGRAMTNALADSVKAMFARDSLLTHFYNKEMKNGKWDHMMDQAHIGSATPAWRAPDRNKMPEVERISLPKSADMGVAIQGSRQWWPHSDSMAVLPKFNKLEPKKRYIEIFNRGKRSFKYRVKSSVSWLNISDAEGKIDKQKRLWVKVNWDKAPSGKQRIPIYIHGDEKKVTVYATIVNPEEPDRSDINGFAEAYGYISIEAAHYSKAVGTEKIHWQKIPNLGRTRISSGMIAKPVIVDSQNPGGNSPHLEYKIYVADSGKVQVHAYMLPMHDVHNEGGVRFALSIDNQEPKIITMNISDSQEVWAETVKRNIKVMTATLHVDQPGQHVLKFWMVGPGVVLEKLVIDTGGLKKSYLGPPESSIVR